jgi:hypothetical protein
MVQLNACSQNCSTRVHDAHREARKISYHLADKPFNGSLFSLELDHNTHAQSDVSDGDVRSALIRIWMCNFEEKKF